jgi:hypothetical protein
MHLMQIHYCNYRVMGVTSAAVADIVSPENRATAFGFLFGVWSIGFCASAGLAGLFSRVRRPVLLWS